ncbi:hypothetical protein [Actinomadura formosensis]|uniref:hypothetical protein n=1 Tax=Actinomadura formosensis TaxID=60706 RepID=UPI003D90C7B8
MPDPMTPERPRCGTPCLKHAHACDRSPRHIGFHRDVQQAGEHTCEWDTPTPKDFPAVMAALRSARAELAEANFMIGRQTAALAKAQKADAEQGHLAGLVKRVRSYAKDGCLGSKSTIYNRVGQDLLTIVGDGTEAGS